MDQRKQGNSTNSSEARRVDQRPVGLSDTDSLFPSDSAELNVHDRSPYQFARDSVDVKAIVAQAKESLAARFYSSLAGALESTDIWSHNKQILNLKKIQHLAKSSFHSVTGSLFIDAPPITIRQDLLRSFFQVPGRSMSVKSSTAVRGPAYYVARDQALSPEQKLDSMERDMRDAIKVVLNTDRASLGAREYLYFLSVLEHLKVHSIGLYQVITHSERRGEFSSEADYNAAKNYSLQLSKIAVRCFYQHVLGDGLDLQSGFVETAIEQIFDYCRSPGFRERLCESNRFKLQECDHPVVLALNARENALRFKDAERIVALPLGGLQPGLATQFAFELIQGRQVPLVTVPLSMHSGAEHRTDHLNVSDLVRVIAQYDVQDKVVLVTEDNSNTGKTAHLISEALYTAGAKRVHVSLVELDVVRVEHKHKYAERYGRGVVNLGHPDFVTAVRESPIRIRDEVDIQRAKAWADYTLERAKKERRASAQG